MSQVSTEIGRASTATTSLNETPVRSTAGVASGTISFSNLRGKSAMTVTPHNASNSYSSATAGGTATASPNVTVSGGTPSYTYNWTVTGNVGGATVTGLTTSAPLCSKTFAKLEVGSFDVTLNCTVTDSLGYQKTVTGVTAHADWS